jgi:hypothetical protein
MSHFKTKTVVLVAATLWWLAAPDAGAGIVRLDFDNIVSKAVAQTGPDAAPYLAPYGITLTNLSPSGPSGQVQILNWNYGGAGDWIDENFLYQNGGGAPPCSYTMNFSTPLLSISFNRIATPHDLSYIPRWSATAYVGTENVGSVGVPYIQYVYGGTAAQTYTLSGDGITSLTMYANGGGFTGIGAVPFDHFVLNEVPEPSTLIVWSLLGGLGIAIGWWRKRKTA